MKTTYHYDRDLKKMVKGRARRKVEPNHDFNIIDDLKPYEAVAGDMAGKMIDGRAEHREFLRRNDLEEVGNEKDYFFRWHGRTHENRHRD